MKKIVALLLALMLCLGSFPALAVVDLNEYDQDQLIALRNRINAELLKRGITKKVVVPVGVYIVGEDIPAGSYSIYTASKDWFSGFRVEDPNGDFYMYESITEDSFIGKVVLKDGYIVEIEYDPVTFYPYQGLGF